MHPVKQHPFTMIEATYKNESQTINTTSQLVLPDRSSLKQRRISMIITNTGATTIYLSIDKEATAGAGIPLYAGGSIERTAGSEFLPPQKQIHAISDALGGTLSVFEEVYQ